MMDSMLPFTIPDIRFEQNFRNHLKQEARKSQSVISSNYNEEPKITIKIVIKVILKNVLFMPFLQSILWTGFRISLKLWLKVSVRQGRNFGKFLYSLVSGKT